MCGIVGYIGAGGARRVILDGLKRLEYRGYDSAGIAALDEGRIVVEKAMGRIANLEARLEHSKTDGRIGIGHTRWATHGEPSDANAHPHTDESGRIAIVHNGIIENHLEIKTWLRETHGTTFRSETDSEVVAQLIGVLYRGDLMDAVYEAAARMRGAYAIGVIAADEPDRIVALRKDAPLIAGIGEGCNFLASDIPALLKYVRTIYLIENNETVLITENDISIYNEKREKVRREVFHVTWDADAAEKDGYDHFMLKEIHEQPKGLLETLNRQLDADGLPRPDGVTLDRAALERVERIYIVACGTAYHAGLIGKFAIEKYARIPVETDIASEFRYRDPYVNDRTLVIGISQSGETLDTLAALREAKSRGARVLSVVNVVGSSAAREADDVLYTRAGPEIAVASTKAFTTQLMSLYTLALYMGRTLGRLNDADCRAVTEELRRVPEKMERLLADDTPIRRIADQIYQQEGIFFIGRGLDAAVSSEASLKLKEISYIHAFAIAAGELKHGTIALIERGTLVVVVASQDRLFEKTLSNIEEVRARGARVIALVKEGNPGAAGKADETLFMPACSDDVAPLLAVVPLQLLAYHVARLRGCDIDKPKNLAKSVTVE